MCDATSAHCSYLDVYISQKIRFSKGGFESFNSTYTPNPLLFLAGKSDGFAYRNAPPTQRTKSENSIIVRWVMKILKTDNVGFFFIL